MQFKECLNSYIEQIGCTARELSDITDISPAVISRYRSGERIPSSTGGALEALAAGISSLSSRLEKPLRREEILSAMKQSLQQLDITWSECSRNLAAVLSAADISNIALARALNYDPSFISKVLSGSRKPSDLPAFLTGVSDYVVRNTAGDGVTALEELLETPLAGLPESKAARVIEKWLSTHKQPEEGSVNAFLDKLDQFDLNEYIRAIHFDSIKPPAPVFRLPGSKCYNGIAQMMECELEFLKTVSVSKSTEPLIMYSDMSITEMAEEQDFAKKWIYGVAVLLKKGLKLNIIHDLNRPFNEMLLGLEMWIPLYMTGQICPYYLKAPNSEVFCHQIKTGGGAALAGEALKGHLEEGRLYLTTHKDDVAHYRRMSETLLSIASPLMQIYREDQREQFRAFLKQEFSAAESLILKCSAPPLCFVNTGTLEHMLDELKVSLEERQKILEYQVFEYRMMKRFIDRASVTVEYPLPDEDMVEDNPVNLPLSGIFLEKTFRIPFQAYQEMHKETVSFAKHNQNLTIHVTRNAAFRNVEMMICNSKWAMVSKNMCPAVHFVIRHPRLVSALERFTAPIWDNMTEEDFL